MAFEMAHQSAFAFKQFKCLNSQMLRPQNAQRLPFALSLSLSLSGLLGESGRIPGYHWHQRRKEVSL